jgi:hypothetical protein
LRYFAVTDNKWPMATLAQFMQVWLRECRWQGARCFLLTSGRIGKTAPALF